MRLALFLFAIPIYAQPVRSVTDPGIITTRQQITPAGVPAVFQGRVYGVDFGAASSEIWVATATTMIRLDWRQNRVLESVPLGGAPGLQGVRLDASSNRALAAVAARDSKEVRLSAFSASQQQPLGAPLGKFLSGALAIAGRPNPQGIRVVAIPLTYDNQLAVLDAATGTRLGSIKTGVAPFGAAINANGTVAWVTNWGGPFPGSKDRTAALGRTPTADRILVDDRGVASTGTAIRIDLATLAVTHTITVPAHPNSLVWDEKQERLYIASSNRDSITVLDTKSQKVIATHSVQPFREKAAGVAPTALALTPDGSRLLIACGGINAVAVMATHSGKIEGLIPTAWYPSSLSISKDGKHAAIGALLGVGSGWRDAPSKRFVHAYRGAVSVIEMPDAAQLASFSTAVAENNHLSLGPTQPAPRADPSRPPSAVPARAGEPSLIDTVVFIIKENRTYDQVLGDMKKGNGDPSLVMFGEDVTPNHHRLADQYVLLDNFYATGGNSADGHQWVTQANENAYAMWPGFAGRSYPFDGSDALAISEGGFLWDAALHRGRTVAIYGEYAGVTPASMPGRHQLLERWQQGADFSKDWQTTSPVASMNKVLARHYPAYTTAIPDVVRARIFLNDLKQWERDGKMPNLVMLQLPSDHTNGTLANASTPKAMVADNDLALGQIVESLSRSRFWNKMAIFVVEDDAQNGVDHVDGHRTVALAVSPYTRRGHVDSTFYSHQSILKTIELMLGLPTLSLFDLIANDMRASFTNTPDLTPYQAVTPAQSLTERNPAATALKGEAKKAAIASARMKWHLPDAAPTERVNRILWGSIKGWSVPYPGVRTSAFAPLSLEIDDDDR
ncbi:MAG TPA: alkaline phosphatase family protein [Bryobacteraceae bacterium]|nr:alkaline phosphatase family protein [Bryobacteraceae bacterium]